MKMICTTIAVALLALIFGATAARAQTDSIAPGQQMINFSDTAFALQEVTVKSSLPKTRMKGDALRTNVTGTILEKAGSAADVLNRIPQLTADREGNVEVFGRGSAEVYVNGRKVLDPKELARITSEQVKSVDVVQNPGARYAASTKAVVRIQLKKAQGEGFSFVEKASGMYKYGWGGDNNLDVNYRNGGLDVTASFWCGRYNVDKSLQENDLTYYVGDNFYLGRSNQDAYHRWGGLSPQLQVNYMIDENHSFGAFYKFDRHPSRTYNVFLYTDNYENGNFVERSESRITQRTTLSKHIFNAYYSGKVGKLSIDFNLDGFFDTDDETNSTDELTIDADGRRTECKVKNLSESKNRFIASKLVFSCPVWNGTLSFGGEYSHNNRTDIYSVVSEEPLPVTPSDTRIKESAASAFAEYGRRFGRLFVQAGVRYENLSNAYYNYGVKDEAMSRTYGDIFPSLMMSMPVGKTQLSLSYRRDIQRPSYDNLTNSTIYINKYTYQTGNPYLKPTYTHNIVMNVAYKALNLAVNYARTKDVVTLLTEPFPGSQDPLLSILHPQNSADGYDKLIIMPSYRPTFGKWHPTWGAGLVLQNYTTMTAAGTEMEMNRPLLQIYWNNDIELPCAFRLNVAMEYKTKGDYDNFRITKQAFVCSLGVQRDFNLKTLGIVTADLRCFDIFNSNRTATIVYGVRELTASNPARRMFSIDLKWRFNEARSKYKGKGAGESQKARM